MFLPEFTPSLNTHISGPPTVTPSAPRLSSNSSGDIGHVPSTFPSSSNETANMILPTTLSLTASQSTNSYFPSAAGPIQNLAGTSTNTHSSISSDAPSDSGLENNSSGNSFLHNKKEVAGAFTGVALVMLVIVVMVAVWWRKIRQARERKQEAWPTDTGTTLVDPFRAKWASMTTTVTPSLHRAYAGLGKEFD